MTRRIKSKNKKGIILIEAILALGIIVVIMTALVSALVSSISSSNFANEQSIATGYAQEGIEIARNDKDTDFGAFSALSEGTYCLNQGVTTVIGAPASGGGCTGIDNYTRTIYVNSSPAPGRCESSQAVFVASTVTWSDSRCSGASDCHKVELNSCFINLNSF